MIIAHYNQPCKPWLMPRLLPLPSTDRWSYLETWQFHSETGLIVRVPKGFICDLDSVPRIPFIYSLFKNRCVAAPGAHDWTYVKRTTYTQKEADDLMLEIALWEGTPEKYIQPMYRAVRMFGSRYYDKKPPKFLKEEQL